MLLKNTKLFLLASLTCCFLINSQGFAATTTDKFRQARLPTSSLNVLQKLAKDTDWRVRREVASNRKASVKILTQLANDPRAEVKITVATNIATPESVFMVLARDKDINIRSVVARFEFVPETVLDYLAHDPEVDIRLEVARAFNTSNKTLAKLMLDEYPRVRQLAEQTLNNR